MKAGDKSCAYLRWFRSPRPERSRTSASVIEEAKRLADAGYSEIQLLARTSTVTAILARRLGFRHFARPCPAASQAFAGALHHFASARFRQAIIDAIDANPNLCNTVISGAVRFHRAY